MKPPPGRMGPEDRLLRWLEGRLAAAGPALVGDDAAVVGPGERYALTVDQQVEGVHFIPGLAPERVARRLLAVNLSDVAAMGGKPRWALCALAAPLGFHHRRFLAELERACRGRGVVLAGGDLSGGERLVASLTLVAERSRRGRWTRRRLGRPDDRLWLGDTVGESATGRLLLAAGVRPHGRGLRWPGSLRPPAAEAAAGRRAVARHLEPRPALALGRWLAGRRRAAAIDISDGLLLDLRRLCRASGVRAALGRAALHYPADLEPLAARLGRRPAELALTGGEDYALLFALPAGERPPPRLGCVEIGRLERGTGVDLGDLPRPRAAAAEGWDHLRPLTPSRR